MPKPRITGSAQVDAFIASLEHPYKDAVIALRQVLLAADPVIVEGIKWNAPSFRTADDFATMHLRAKQGIGLILHFGAKKRDVGTLAIADPHGLLHWLAADRAMLGFADAADVGAKAAAVTAVLRQWIAALPVR